MTDHTSEIRTALIRFVLAGLASLVLVSVPTVLLFQNIAQGVALDFAAQNGRNLANRVLAPLATPAAQAGDKEAVARIDSAARARMRDGSVAAIRIWDLAGRVIYSEVPALIGHVLPLPPAAARLSAGELTTSEVTPPSAADKQFHRSPEHPVAVYTMVRVSTGQQLIFETHFPISLVNQAQDKLLREMAPVALSALVLLNLAQLPSALHLARQVQQYRASRQRLLVQAVAAADHERRGLAQKLHDDVIQDLAGVGYALSSLSEHDDAKNGPTIERVATVVARDLELLRAMVTGLYPRAPDPQSLAASLRELAGSLRDAGVEVEIDVQENLTLGETSTTLVWRVARECLQNAWKHAQPRNVEVRLARAGTRTVLMVVDDGRGFEPASEPEPGHFGLKLIRDTVAEAGGTLLVDSVIGRGTRVELSLPGD